jgi:nitroreductase
MGHALGALRIAAALLGWQMTLLPRWSDADVSALLGLEREGDFLGAEREAPGCLVLVAPDTAHIAVPDVLSSGLSSRSPADPAVLVAAARAGTWRGRANQLSRGHVDWPIIDEVASATIYPGHAGYARAEREPPKTEPGRVLSPGHAEFTGPPARDVILRRRSAVAFDPRASLPLEALRSMLLRLRPGAVPWDVLDWAPHVHLALFIHRVDGLVPGVYVFLRDPAAEPDLRAAMRSEFLWEPVHDLFLLLPTDVTWVANRLSCDQDIAGEGFFSLAMLSRMEAQIAERGDWFYRRLFWESGLIGQVLYLEAEARGVRGTGIGCFYDDAVHEALGLSGHAWQSIYHFAMGAPLEDTRLTTEPGYDWDR